MLDMILVVGAVTGLGVLGYRKLSRHDHGTMTPAREIIYENALRTANMPADKLRKLADAFEREGLRAQAMVLRRRADNADLPQATKDARQEAFRKAMASTNADAIDKVAAAFDSQGVPASAEKLRERARGLREAAKAHVAVVESPPAQPPPTTPAPAAASPGSAASPAHGETPHGKVNGIATGIAPETDGTTVTT